MKIKKILLKDMGEGLLFAYPENTISGDENFQVGFSVGRLEKNKKLCFGNNRVSSCHTVMDGQAEVLNGWAEALNGQAEVLNGSVKVHSFKPGESFSCEENERIEVTGSGQVFNMFMAGGIRGFIRKVTLKKEQKMRVGEPMGVSVMAFAGLEAGFYLESGKERIQCEAGSAVIVQVDKQEFQSLTFIPEQAGMSMLCATGVRLGSHDFGKFVGVHFLERREGVCKARLDIRPEHMNPIGTVHGGCLFTLADAVCGIAASSHGSICTTVSSNIQFLNAAFRPKYLIAEAKPKKLGRKIRTFLVEIWDDKGTLICTVDMIFYSLQQ